MVATVETKRSRFVKLKSQLELEYSSFRSHHQTLGDYILPTRPRFITQDRNWGKRRNEKILDTTATMAARTLAAGMMAGITSPARKWFHLTISDPALAQIGAVKDWLDEVETRMYRVLSKCGIYKDMPQLYEDCGTFGTSPMLIEEDLENVIRTYVFPVGSYYISQNAKGDVILFMRVWQMTVRQIVDEYAEKNPRTGAVTDWSNISGYVRNLWEHGERETWVEVCQVILPNDEYDQERLSAKYKKWASCTFETGATTPEAANYIKAPEDGLFLKESGYDKFPVLVPRWALTGEDVYGTNCPGMTCLPDVKQLQKVESRILQAQEKVLNPPMGAPIKLKGQRVSVIPGDTTYYDLDVTGKLEPLYQINPNLEQMERKQELTRGRINEAYFKRTFLMFSDDPTRQPITAAEVAARESEKLLQLGPVLERLDSDLLDPLIELLFFHMENQGLIPDKPAELLQGGAEITIEYVSVMAQAQKAAGLAAIDRFWSFLAQVATANPTVLDNIDLDRLIEEYAERTGVPKKIIVNSDKVAAIRAQRQKGLQAQTMAQAIPPAAKAAKDLSDASLDGNNALTELLNRAKAGQLQRAA